MRIGKARAGVLAAGIACLAALALLVSGERSHAASSKPNIIMFTTDDQTVRDLIAMPKTQALLGAQGANFFYSANNETPALSSYFELMDRVIPSFLGTLSSQKVKGTRFLLQ